MRVGLDDTDSRNGGCTTHILFHLLTAVPDLALRGPPSLVRLNPNNPRKTRGNGAIAFELVRRTGPATVVGSWQGSAILAHPEGERLAASPAWLDRLWSAVAQHAEPDAASGLLLVDQAEPASFYWDAVRRHVEAPELRGLHRTRNEGWGLIGARAALAWPGPPTSFELIAYRHPASVGSPRLVTPAPLASLDASVSFHSIDPDSGRPTCVPNTPCPVLAGVRSRNAARLLREGLPAMRAALEPFDTWMLWQTNQASGDHVTPVASVAQAPPLGTVGVAARVTNRPRRAEGGHLAMACQDDAGTAFEAMAFEPTKGFRDVVDLLRPGDRILAVGAFADGALRLEKLRVDATATETASSGNPLCSCGDRMKSAGAGVDLRCPTCGSKAPRRLHAVERTVALGWHEVPVGARRHLHRPVAWGAGDNFKAP